MTSPPDHGAGIAGGPPPPPAYGYPAVPGFRPPPPLSPSGQPLGGFGTRLAAYLIDTVAVAVIVGIVVAAVMAAAGPRILEMLSQLLMSSAGYDSPEYREAVRDGRADGLDFTLIFTGLFLPVLVIDAAILLFALLCWYLYTVEVQLAHNGQTLGKRIMGIRVVPLNPYVGLTRGALFRRYLVQAIGGTLVPFLHHLDGLWTLWDKPYQQALHDKAAKTVVVKVSP